MPGNGKNRKAGHHPWRFLRAGGFDQVRLDTGADLAALDQLDQKLWVALSCPTQGLEFDTRTLERIDTDKDGRIRAPDILAATRWACAMLKDPDGLLKGSPVVELSAINDAAPEGRQLLSSARWILANLGKPDTPAISIEDVASAATIFAQTKFNGDGVIPADSADDPATKSVIQDIISCVGPETDRSGKPGASQAEVDRFFSQAQAYSDWWAQAENDAANVLPLGEATVSAASALSAVRAKVDDYFARCRLAAFDRRAVAALNRQESEYLAIAAKDLTIDASEVSGFPLAAVEAGRHLALRTGLNPAWAGAIGRFADEVVGPLLGDKDALSEADWAAIQARFAAYDAWSAGKAGAAVERLGLGRVREILAGPGKEAVTALIAQDKALEGEANAIAAVDKLVRFNRDLYKLLNNFVCFREFYGRRDKAVFQAGTLYLDQRSCDLCIRVDDMAKHAGMAHLSRAYLAYCDLARKSTGEKMTIVAALTAGDSDNLMVGRNGLFYDRMGRDWDATVVKIVENPISIRQAFWSPYKRVIRWVEEQAAKRAAAADAAATDALTASAAAVSKSAQTSKPPEHKPKFDVGVVAALGVAVGGITAALGVLLQVFFGLGAWMPAGVVVLILLVSGPSMIIAWLKLRQRNLGPLLDANGWAVNTKARINIPFGASLTGTAKLPPGSHRNLTDPFAEKKTGRYVTLAVLAGLAAVWGLWYFGLVEKIAPNVLPKSGYVVRRQAAAQQKAVQPAPPPGNPVPASAPASQPVR